MESRVLHALTEATTIIAMFDLWMSHDGFDTFALVANYINRQWIFCHVIVRFLKFMR
jgi:hypothetical protein